MINGLVAGLRATAMAYGSAGRVMSNNQTRLHLANGARPDLTFGDTFRLQSADKALELANVQASFNYEVALAQQDLAQRMLKKHFEQKQQAIQNGWLA